MTLGDRVAVMRAGMLQQVANPRELYENPRNLFVAGFIGSPAMNFFAGSIEDSTIRTPMGAVPLADSIRRSLEQYGHGARDVIVGVRPEDFEDAEFAPEGHEGFEFDAPIELTESMGSEIYAHFDFSGDHAVDSDELRELQEDAGTADVPSAGGAGHAVARVDAASGVKAGERSRLWLAFEKIHLFDPSDGSSLTRDRSHDHDLEGAPSNGGGAGAQPAAERSEGGATSMGEEERPEG
jgi:multiple sugar transport system ATP-binding protein